MKKMLLFCCSFLLISCGELRDIAGQFPQPVSENEIASGLRQALDTGIDKQVSKLTEEGGFFDNPLVRITLPEELQQVDRRLREIGLENLADQGQKILNRAAEEAVKEATPVFVNAVKEITFTDARSILLGKEDAATLYLIEKTKEDLYRKFQPIIKSSLDKVGATEIWRNIISRYNTLPLTGSVNPDLTDYVTSEALDGVYIMIALEEKEIRTNFSARSTTLLKRVFALQD